MHPRVPHCETMRLPVARQEVPPSTYRRSTTTGVHDLTIAALAAAKACSYDDDAVRLAPGSRLAPRAST